MAALYASIMAISRRQQRQLVHEGAEDPGYAAWLADLTHARTPVSSPRVVYQGEPGCYSEEAAAGFFGPEVDSRGLAWFTDVFAALERGEADYAVLPVENSSTGSIRQVYDLLAQYSYYIVGEWQVKVEHCLMALPGVTLDDIRTVYSHEQGLMQCETFLDAHRDWQRVPTLDTAGSAKQVAATGDRTAAAICSRRAAELYGLHILAEEVNYNSQNHTRFVVVSPVPEQRPERNKISALFTPAPPERLPPRDPHHLRRAGAQPAEDRVPAHPRPELGVPVLPGVHRRPGRPRHGRRAPRAEPAGRRHADPGQLQGL